MTAHEALTSHVPTLPFIAGAWAEGSGRRFDVLDPATGEHLATVAGASVADGLRALDAAVAAQADWAATAPRRRSEILRRAWEILLRRSEEFALLISLEMGKPVAEAHGEIAYGGEFLRWFSEEAVRVTGRYGPNPAGTGTAIVSRSPVGPCYLITPWNFPLAMATRKIAPALAAGCTVIVKPAEATPLTTMLLGQVLEEAGVPAGVVNIVPTDDAPGISSAILADPRLRKLSFTGSTPVGRSLLAQASETVLRTSMELGGNAPFLVFDDADIDAAADGAMLAKFRNMGQACTAANRFIVHEDVIDGFTDRVVERVRSLVVGPGTDPASHIGPLIDERAVQRSTELVADAVARGARLLVGGSEIEGPGTFFAPTVLVDVPAEARLLREEIFAPVLAITAVRSEDDAVRSANDTEYGLVAYAYTRDIERAHRLVRTLDAGMLGVNTGLVSDASAPFGGVKQSGLGREGSFEGIDEYLETRYALIGA